MAEKEKEQDAEEQEPKKKKKGKLPVILVLALLLGAGGFFGMKMRGGEAKDVERVVELGEIEQLDEFLVNLSDPNVYVRTDIALHFAKDFDRTQLPPLMPPIRDAINLKLKSTSLAQVSKAEGMLRLKAEIAGVINVVLLEAAEAGKKTKKEEPAAASEGKLTPDPRDAKDPKEPAPPPEPEADKIPDGWDSAKGPVLKVYFVNFATQ
jgi:flagellar basal body-associated protein FliL